MTSGGNWSKWQKIDKSYHWSDSQLFFLADHSDTSSSCTSLTDRGVELLGLAVATHLTQLEELYLVFGE